MTISLPIITLLAVLFLISIGFYSLLILRNMIKVIVALQLLVKGTMLALVLAGKMTGQVDLSQSMALTVVVADTIVAVIGLSLAVQVRRYFGTLDVNSLTNLRR